MRSLALLLPIFLTGCLSVPYSAVQSPTGELAFLAISAKPSAENWPDYHGIWSVDNRFFPMGPTSTIFVHPGKRTIGYACPGWLFLDGPPTLKYKFEAGKTYDLVCIGSPKIREHVDATGNPAPQESPQDSL